MNSPADFSITRQSSPFQGDYIRLEAKDGRKILAQLDMSLEDFTKALTGETVMARFSEGEP